MDEWDGIGNSKLAGLREDHPLQEEALWHDEQYKKGELPLHEVTGGFLKKGWLQVARSVWDAGSTVLVMTIGTVIVPIWDLVRYKKKE